MLGILKNRFQGNMNLHPELQWADVENRLREKPDVMEVLRKMEKSGGEPDTIGAVSRIPLVLIKKQGN